MSLRLIVFCKAPVAGKVKTRLVPVLGLSGAAKLAHALLANTLAAAQAAADELGESARIELCGSPEPEHADWSGVALPSACRRTAQIEGDLGRRMAHAFDQAMAQGDDVLLFGTDGPGLDAQRLLMAARSLSAHDAVLQPVTDGGYLLLGLKARTRQHSYALFEAMPWSTDQVAAITLCRLQRLSLSVEVLPPIHDIDEPADLVNLPENWPVPTFRT
jgi:rSAM/selenodomain-associated transferase 1